MDIREKSFRGAKSNSLVKKSPASYRHEGSLPSVQNVATSPGEAVQTPKPLRIILMLFAIHT
jgi:hypothetical protein